MVQDELSPANRPRPRQVLQRGRPRQRMEMDVGAQGILKSVPPLVTHLPDKLLLNVRRGQVRRGVNEIDEQVLIGFGILHD